MAETQTGLTVYCPRCGHAGFRFQRVTDQSAIDLHDEANVRRHQPMAEVVAGLRMVCANPQCGHELES